jgi:hypothetical protein
MRIARRGLASILVICFALTNGLEARAASVARDHKPHNGVKLGPQSFEVQVREMVVGDRTIALLREESGTAFDPKCVAALERVLRVRLDKGERYTDWSRRPLSERQLAYAAADVADLLELSDRLDARAAALGRGPKPGETEAAFHDRELAATRAWLAGRPSNGPPRGAWRRWFRQRVGRRSAR